MTKNGHFTLNPVLYLFAVFYQVKLTWFSGRRLESCLKVVY